MTTSYFDPNNEEHTNLLPSALRKFDNLETIAAQAEFDVIDRFTSRFSNITTDLTALGYYGRAYVVPGTSYVVTLDTFNPDADEPTVDPNLVIALRHTIADVVRWRLVKDNEPGALVTSSNFANGGGKSFRDDFTNQFPPGPWSFRLRRWKIERPTVVL